MNCRPLMKDLPAFLRKASDSKHCKLDDAADAYQPLLGHWLIEMALNLGWYRKTRKNWMSEIFSDADFLSLTGIEPPPEEPSEDDFRENHPTKMSDAAFVRLLKKRLSVLSRERIKEELPLFANIELIGRLLGLSNAEKAILTFAAVVTDFHTFRSAIESRNEEVSTKKLAQIIALLTGQPDDEIRSALRDEAVLVASGIVTVNQNICDMERKLDLSSGLGNMLLQKHPCEDNLVNRFLKQAGRPTLDLSAFPHLTRDIEVLQKYLSNAMLGHEQGANVLFYGPPGTGKTELAKAIAHKLGVELFEIPFSDPEGDPIRGKKRLRAYNLCQKLLERKQNVLLMFDEIEDVFESRRGLLAIFGGDDKDSGKNGKAWINRTLERNTTPAIWITNDPSIDAAYLRRFDYSVRFPIPPQNVRLDIARHHLESFNPDNDWLARIAANEHTSPAQIERAAKVARIAGSESADTARALVEQTLDRSATLLDQKRTPTRNLLRTRYDLNFINTDADVGKLIASLRQRPRGSFCFYGPAGTGKSELARHIADEIGKPIILRRASDLLSKYVGEAEQNIAEMFAEARQQDAVLVLDEADSFLADRRDAQRSWEVTQVNELLTQMEACEGIFVCTTNLMQKLDQASLRRFAFKMKFDFLDVEQRWSMFQQELARFGGDPASTADWKDPVCRLDNLTPGDFAVVARQYELWGTIASAGELYEQLRRECAAKEGQSRCIGFTA